MNIYVVHSTSFDFNSELYLPIRNSSLNTTHRIKLPHELSSEVNNSMEVIKNSDLIIAEVSYPSTGMGIELGWANTYDKRVVCIYRKDTKPSSSLKVVSNEFIEYTDSTDLVNKLIDLLK